MKKIILLTMIVFLIVTDIAIAANKAKKSVLPVKVRVAIVREARELNLKIEGAYTFIDAVSGKELSQGLRMPQVRVRLLEKGIFMGMNVYSSQRIIVETTKENAIIVNKHHFRGRITIVRTPNDRLTVINALDIEDYIKGVLYHEVSHHWPMEALKAQAVATRTYALYSMGNNANKDYDVTNDIYSQVYGGKASERYRTGLAVERTAGEILVYKSRILPAYFHATCAGMTEDAKELWKIDLNPLKGVPCLFCQDSPHMQWKKNFRLQSIQEELNRHGYPIGLIKDMRIVDRNRSGRINDIEITDRNDQQIIITGKYFREVMGPNILKSNNYEILMQGYYVDFIGKGWGHGVGLCQWGARGMAAQQFNHKQILKYYYPSAQILDYHGFFSPSTKP